MSLQLISNPPPWPGGARCAVCMCFDFDAESLLHLFYGADAGRHVSAASELRFGATIAVPRIVDIWKHFGIRQTMYVPGWCVEEYPHAIALLVENGHEIGHHGWLHERVNQHSPDDERRILEKGMRAIENATGRPPAGYRNPSGAFSEYTLDLLVEHGFRYDASLYGDDVPYMLKGTAGSLIELPSTHALDDWPQYVHTKAFKMAQTIRAPAEAMAVFRAEFDAAWQYGGLWSAIWHPFVSGRLSRAAEIVKLLEYMHEKGDVWFAPMEDIAAHISGLMASGTWTPHEEQIPRWIGGVPALSLPVR